VCTENRVRASVVGMFTLFLVAINRCMVQRLQNQFVPIHQLKEVSRLDKDLARKKM
jgi:hypothetical protein